MCDTSFPLHLSISMQFQGAEFLTSKIYITPSRASKSAVRAIEDGGGQVVCKYYNPLALQDCVKGRTDRIAAAPTRRQDISKQLSPVFSLCS